MDRACAAAVVLSLAACVQPCAPGNCHGCCDVLGQCVVGTSAEGCGAGGHVCVACRASNLCANGACAPAPCQCGRNQYCDAGSCFDVCVDCGLGTCNPCAQGCCAGTSCVPVRPDESEACTPRGKTCPLCSAPCDGGTFPRTCVEF